MGLLSRLLDILAFVGRYGTQGFVISLFAGLALPQLAAAARPYLSVAIFTFVTMTFMRIETSALRDLVARPFALLLSCACLVLVPLLVVTGVVAVLGREAMDPGLLLGLAILAAAPPMMSAPAIAMLLRVEPALILTAVLALTILSPVLAPPIVHGIAGAAIPLDPGSLVLRLIWLVGGAILCAAILRRLLGLERIRRRKDSFDGFSVIMYFVFAIAAMDGVLAAMLSEPVKVVRLLAIAIMLSLTGFILTWMLLRPVAPAERLVLGYATGQRNMGLLIAALGTGTPDTTFLFFALAQFPIYIGPQIIKPLARRYLERAP